MLPQGERRAHACQGEVMSLLQELGTLKGKGPWEGRSVLPQQNHWNLIYKGDTNVATMKKQLPRCSSSILVLLNSDLHSSTPNAIASIKYYYSCPQNI